MNKIIVFDTYGGLCNQFMDINYGINFCIINNIKFSFRYCSFRNKDLTTMYNENFEKLFDKNFLNKYDLYIDYNTLNLTNENTYNLHDTKIASLLFKNNILNEINKIDKQFVIIKQFVGVNNCNLINTIYKFILPSKRLFDIYNNIKNQILNTDEKYNYIHYRYEKDFTDFFKVKIEDLKILILKLKLKFKNPNLKIYIATSNITKLININDNELCNIILTKKEDTLINYNFEEKAFIDFMFGLDSEEVYGHHQSSFSCIINFLKNTQNYYDRL